MTSLVDLEPWVGCLEKWRKNSAPVAAGTGSVGDYQSVLTVTGEGDNPTSDTICYVWGRNVNIHKVCC